MTIGKDTGAASHASSFDTEIGNGGELHQQPKDTVLTTQQGVRVADDQNSLRVGERGPTLLEDFHFREKIFHFDHERIPERVVHALGSGAYGTFQSYGDWSNITSACWLQNGSVSEAFTRFSVVVASTGGSEVNRDTHGFATKIYSSCGNQDLVGNHVPSFFIVSHFSVDVNLE